MAQQTVSVAVRILLLIQAARVGYAFLGEVPQRVAL
jgi:hypothetical protein